MTGHNKQHDETAKPLTDYSRDAQGEPAVGSSMDTTDRILLGTLLRIADGIEQLLEIATQDKLETKPKQSSRRGRGKLDGDGT